MKRIVVLVITYNQENVIRRALDSVLTQKDWGLYRLVVSDDCSKDHTWEILNDYHSMYPNVVEIHQNEHNLGIYENIAKAESYLPECDLYCTLSGDDEFCDGYFKGVQTFIDERQIDTTKLVGIFSDWKSISPSGQVHVFNQNHVMSGYSLFSLKLRGLITNRSLLLSKCVHDKFQPIILDRGLAMAEGSYDIQPHILIKQAYYLPLITSIYYSRIGVSSKLVNKKSDYNTTQQIIMWQCFIDDYVKDSRDFHHAKYELLKARFYLKPSFGLICSMYYHFQMGQLPKLRISTKKKFHIFFSYLKYMLHF